MPTRFCQVRLAALLLLILSSSVLAIESARLKTDNLQFAGLDLRSLDIRFNLTENGLAMQAAADRLQLAGEVVNDVELNCRQFKIAAGFWQCRQGRLQFSHATFGKQQLTIEFTANTEIADYQVQLTDLALADGRFDLNLYVNQQGWQADIDSQQANLTTLLALVPQVLPDVDLSKIADWQIAGHFSGKASLGGNGAQLKTADLQLTSPDLSFSDVSGERVAEALDLTMDLTAHHQQGWQFQTDVAVNSGQSYWSPVFIDFQQTPVQFAVNGSMETVSQSLKLDDIHFRQQDVLSATGTATIEQNQLLSLHLSLKPSPLQSIYQWWLQPFVPGTAAANLDTGGEIGGELDWQAGQLTLQADLQQLHINDTAGRFAIDGLDGQFAWTSGKTPLPVDLSWQQITLGELPVAASQLQADVSENQLTLRQTLELPILDGALQISAFHYQFAPDGSRWQFEGLLKPLSMQALTKALGWPEMDGKLSGVIPKVSYRDQQIDIEGALQVKVFDGTTIITDLQLQSPFGSLPQLTANMDMQRLDLELLTRTFDFGKISGRLNGQITDLRLLNWRPVQFDARFATAATDPGKRRISQRAVDNLSQIGGGASGVMSRSFLRFFDDFSYDKLGIRCQLNNEVCQMSGVEDDEQGYYIVKGGGLPPWINVKGYTRRVDWPDLLARLKAVQNSDGPIIE